MLPLFLCMVIGPNRHFQCGSGEEKRSRMALQQGGVPWQNACGELLHPMV